MEYKFGGSITNQKTVLGHPSGLFVLFFTEMWERFSYYGMRALLVLFLVASVFDEGWGWERADALTLYAFYTGLVYVTPIFGGLIADKITGYRKAVVIGAVLMTLGHASMALEGLTGTFFYLGLILLIIGNGMFKPNISSMVGKLYKTEDKEKDAGYTIFYMGINAGAFLGILLCGYIGESVGWHYGFGLAGIFMFIGMLQFYFAQEIFGKIGLSPKDAEDFDDAIEEAFEDVEDAVEATMDQAKKSKVTSDRLIVIGVLAFFTIFFWWAFEQAGGSMTIFAADYTDRVLEGDGALIFKIFNTLLTVIPMIIITWVLGMLFKQTFSKYALSNILLGSGFVVIWAIVIWMLYRQFTDPAPEVPASWFGILNSFFIIAFAPVFSKIWESKYNPSGPVKFAIGLILLGIGFGILAFGSMGIPLGAKTASVSMIFLILAYLFHTLGELCVSPVGLSYVSKLSPAKLVGLMFGIWFVANFIANTAAGLTGSVIDPIVEDYGMATFFMIFTIIPIAAGIIMLAISKLLVKMMHGIR
ncbi:POT family proton-dependent oligopeptide transporter [Nonlabens dokdonensis]|jgi:POT family proton-dependent oligopeptide transporter|uniref:POT family proton-dependent oligopeptide transporter n=2 Tax=Nonlabens dokdonensis TaxID=328515 RepID=A0ABX5PYX6_9FLAO|nr:peptide MFS transporter [Nonlabens dokdonensis]AGC77165.1 putative transmembrane di-/tripeptide permease [Nonlabens dokdonensis DSW-6]PZX41123.1 POT family proton-dependent oligopeptide transporter [Nonlabens dokdonensis]